MTNALPVMLDPTIIRGGGLLTTDTVRQYVSLFCTTPLDVRTFGDSGAVWVCGCGHCPVPDPTPAEFWAKVRAFAWECATRTD